MTANPSSDKEIRKVDEKVTKFTQRLMQKDQQIKHSGVSAAEYQGLWLQVFHLPSAAF